jgi:hypothetical protein
MWAACIFGSFIGPDGRGKYCGPHPKLVIVSSETRASYNRNLSNIEEIKMSNYVFAFYGEPKFGSAEEGANYQAKWRAWAGSIGAAWVNPGNPMGLTKNVSSRGVSDVTGSDRLTGFSVVKADSMDAALDMAKRCPHLEHGSVDVAEAMDMGM